MLWLPSLRVAEFALLWYLHNSRLLEIEHLAELTKLFQCSLLAVVSLKRRPPSSVVAPRRKEPAKSIEPTAVLHEAGDIDLGADVGSFTLPLLSCRGAIMSRLMNGRPSRR